MNDQSNKPRIIYNDDNISIDVIEPPYSAEKVALAVDYLAGSQVDCLCWKVYRRFTAGWPSEVCERDLKVHPLPLQDRQMRHDLYRAGVDYLPHLIEAARKRGIRFFGSFRMNDCHHRSDPASAAEFWKRHQHWRLWEVTDGRNYYNAALDYSYPEVRDSIFAALREFAGSYDADGIELDFCRNPYIFQPSEAWAKRDVLTAFIKQIRHEIGAIGQRKRRPIALLVRVPFAEEKLKSAGMDVRAWIDEQLMDILVMSHLKNNYNLSIEPWQSLCRENGVLFYPSIEAAPQDNALAHNHAVPETPDQTAKRQRAAAQNILGQGADGIYLFNYACLLGARRAEKQSFDLLKGVLSEIGDLDALSGKTRQYVYWQDLPITVEASRPSRFHQTVRFNLHDPAVKDERIQVSITFRQVAEANPHARQPYEQESAVGAGWMKYILNGNEVDLSHVRCTRQPAGAIQSGFTLGEHELIEIRPPASMLNVGENTLAFHRPAFPAERDPSIRVYELLVDVSA